VKELLTYSITFIGIKAPWFSWAAALGLIIWPTYEIIKLIRLSSRNKATTRKLISDVKELLNQFPSTGNRGANACAIDHLNKLFTEIPFLLVPWNTFRSKLIYRQVSPDADEEQVWAIESSLKTFYEDYFLGNDFNKRHFHAIPGIVTGVGLLMTFAAILVALLDVSIIDNKVHGLESLIGGLSGKFVSSVAALLSATVFLILEKWAFHRLNSARLSLIGVLDNLMPIRTEAHMLEEICQSMKSQETAFRTFNSDLALKLKNSFSESMGPILERMTKAIDDLNELTRSSQAELLDGIHQMNNLLKNSEETKQESISGKIEIVLAQLQESLTSSIKEMSKEFNRSLTGTTQDQFSRVAETVGATAEILNGMNTQFAGTQVALQEVIALAKQSTENQLNNGSSLIEKMVNVLGSTLSQMEQRITEMSNTMSSTIEGTAERSSEAAGQIITEVRSLNEQSVQKYLEVLKKQEDQMDRVDLLKQMLKDAVEDFGEYVTGYNEINDGMRNVSQDVKTAMGLLSQTIDKVQKGQDSLNKLAEFARDQVDGITESQEQQKEIWKGIETSMVNYRRVFQDVEGSSANVLSQISTHLQQFSRATQDHFNATVTVANDHVNTAVNKLGTSIEELTGELDDLSEVVSEINKIKQIFEGK